MITNDFVVIEAFGRLRGHQSALKNWRQFAGVAILSVKTMSNLCKVVFTSNVGVVM